MMDNNLLTIWATNPGQRYVKDCISTPDGRRRDLAPYPAVIAPYAIADDTGLAKRTKELTAHVGGAHYIGGQAAERLPLANRQQDASRLDAESPLYEALAQMSAQHVGLAHANGTKPQVLLASALPVAWRLNDPTAEARLEAKLRAALKDIIAIKQVIIQSEPNSVLCCEMLDDNGQLRKDMAALATGLVCVGDLGGGTLNLSVLDALVALPGMASSPTLGSATVVKDLAQRTGMQYLDAERRLEHALQMPGHDPTADMLLRQYRESTVSAFQEAWKTLTPTAYLFAGGTVHWCADELRRAFGARCRILDKPQHAVAIGLWRAARRKAGRVR